MSDLAIEDEKLNPGATNTTVAQSTPSTPQLAQSTPMRTEGQARRANGNQYLNMVQQLENLDKILEQVDKSDWTSQAKTVLKIVIDEHRTRVTKERGLETHKRNFFDQFCVVTKCSEEQVETWIQEDRKSAAHFGMIVRRVNNSFLREARERAKTERTAKDSGANSIWHGAGPKEAEGHQNEVPKEDGKKE